MFCPTVRWKYKIQYIRHKSELGPVCWVSDALAANEPLQALNRITLRYPCLCDLCRVVFCIRVPLLWSHMSK